MKCMTAHSIKSIESSLCLALGLAVMSSGCVTGHVLESARRHEEVVEFKSACQDENHLYLRYRTHKDTEFGKEVSRHDREAAIRLETLRNSAGQPVDEIMVTRKVLDSGVWERCREVALTRVATDPASARVAKNGLALVPGESDRWLVELDPQAPPVVLPKGAFTHRSTAPWVWFVVPPALVADAIVSPVLVVIGVPVFSFGD